MTQSIGIHVPLVQVLMETNIKEVAIMNLAIFIQKLTEFLFERLTEFLILWYGEADDCWGIVGMHPAWEDGYV